MNKKIYTIDDLLTNSPILRAIEQEAPAFVSADGSDSIDPKAFGSGELLGNVTVQDGYLQSKDYVAGVSGWRLTPTSGDFNFPIAVDSIDIPDTVTANSFHVDSLGNAWWGSTLFATAVASISKAGAAIFSSINITGGTISGTSVASIPNDSNTDLAILELSHNLTFSSSDTSIVAWTAGTITMSNGRTFTIDAGDTTSMSAKTFVYLDIGISSTVLQVTTTFSTAVGANKRLIAICQNNSEGSVFQVIGGSGGMHLTADNLSATTLAAISADMGAITAGTIVLSSSGYVRSGQTDFNTGTGWWLGTIGSTPKFSIGDSTNYLSWDGTYLRIKGSFDVGSGGVVNNSSYTVANLPAQATTVGFNPPSANSAY